MVTIEIQWVNGDKQNIIDQLNASSWQNKSFESEIAAIEWIRRNSKHILRINDSNMLLSNEISHITIMKAIRG